MPKKQSRRSVSVKGTSYAWLRPFATSRNLSMSDVIEACIEQLQLDPDSIPLHRSSPAPVGESAAALKAMRVTPERVHKAMAPVAAKVAVKAPPARPMLTPPVVVAPPPPKLAPLQAPGARPLNSPVRNFNPPTPQRTVLAFQKKKVAGQIPARGNVETAIRAPQPMAPAPAPQPARVTPISAGATSGRPAPTPASEVIKERPRGSVPLGF